MANENNDKRWWDYLSKLCALVLMVAYAVYVINGFAHFIPDGHVAANVLKYVLFYGPLVLIVLVTFEFASDKNVLFRIIIILVWAAIIIASFFPSVINYIIK